MSCRGGVSLSSGPASGLGNSATTGHRLLKWSTAIAVLILALLMWQCGSALMQGRQLADAAVKRFHEQLNAGDFEGIYREADQAFKSDLGHDESIKFLQSLHQKLGLAGSETRLNIRVEANPNGTFLTTSYSTSFATGPATENFTWVKSGGTLKLDAYHIESNPLMMEHVKPNTQ